MCARRHAVVPRPERRDRNGRTRRGTGVAVAAVVGALVAATGFVALTGVGPARTAAVTAAPAPATGAPVAAAAPGPPDCAGVVGGMDDRAKLAQRLMVGVDAADPQGAVRIVRDSRVGGIFIGGNDTTLLRDGNLRRVQEAAGDTKLAVAVDDEGGRVQRIDDIVGDLPSAREMAERTPKEVTDLARERGRQLRDLGITWNLAPTVDVSDQPSNAVIGDRSFSDDPAVVTTYALAWAQGQRESGIYGVLKHFPGHGHSSGDSHQGEVSVPPLDRLERSDLLPYRDLVGPGKPLAGTEGVMVGHLNVPGLTKGVPSSLEPAVYALLRDRYRFDGLVMTDDLGAMKAITDRFGLPVSTVKALSAGADVALFSNVTPVAPLLDAAEKALDDKVIDRAANDTAVARVLAAKGVCHR